MIKRQSSFASGKPYAAGFSEPRKTTIGRCSSPVAKVPFSGPYRTELTEDNTTSLSEANIVLHAWAAQFFASSSNRMVSQQGDRGHLCSTGKLDHSRPRLGSFLGGLTGQQEAA